MECVDPARQNRCLSSHPGNSPTWLFSDAQTRECLCCTLAIVVNDSSIHSVRIAASHRVKLILQNTRSIEVLFKNSSPALERLVENIVLALKSISDNDPAVVLCLVQDIVSSAFAFDLHLLERQSFKFCELLMTVSVSEVGSGSLMDASTTVMMILLSSVVSEAVQRDDVDTGSFYLGFKCAITGKEKLLLSAVADLLISGSSWHDFDVTKASVGIICALLSIHIPIERRFMQEFATKLALGFQGAEAAQQQGNLMQLAFVLLDSFDSKSNSYGDPNGSTNGPECGASRDKEEIFFCLNKENALTDILKLCILSNAQSAKQAAIKVIEICCNASSLLADALVRDGIVEYLFEGLRSHGNECSDSVSCSYTGLYLKALFSVTKQNPKSLVSKWEHGFEIVLKGVSSCVSGCAEELGIPILKIAVRSMNVMQLSSVALAKGVLNFVGHIGAQMRGTHVGTSLMIEMDEEFGCMHKFQDALYFLIDYSSLSALNVECISLFLDVTELALTIFLDNIVVQKVAKALMNQMAHLDGCDGMDISAASDVQKRVLNLVFSRLGLAATKRVEIAVKSETDQCNLANEAVDSLEILQLGLNSSFLFGNTGTYRESMLEWCWQNISPGAVLVIGNNLEVPDGDASKEHRIHVIKDYLYQLLQLESDAMLKSNVSQIPFSTTEFGIALKSNMKTFSSKVACSLLKRSIEMQPVQDESWVEAALHALGSRIAGVNITESESCDNDIFESASLFFYVSSAFEDVDVELKIPTGVWLCLVKSNLFCPDLEPNLFFHVISKVRNSEVNVAAWEKYAVRDKDRVHEEHLLDNKLLQFLQSSVPAMDNLCKLIVSLDLSEELLNVILTFVSNFSLERYSPVPALRQFGAVQALREAFRFDTIRTHNSGTHTEGTGTEVFKNETYQLAGLLSIISENIGDWNPEEVQQLTLMVCGSLRKMKLAAHVTDTTLLLGIVRFFIRLFETPGDDSLKLSRSYVTKSWIVGKLTKVLRIQASDHLSVKHDTSHFVAASSACLLVLIMDELIESGNVSKALKLYAGLPSSPIEWASLVCTLSAPIGGDHSQTCSATNCSTLLSLFLEVAKPSFQQSIGKCRLLRSALVSSAISPNILLSNAALNCLVHIVSKAESKDSRFQQLPMEQALVDFLTAKLLRKNSGILRAEAAFVGICIERNLIDIADNKITEALEALRSSDRASENPYGLRRRDIIQLMVTVGQQREKQGIEVEHSHQSVSEPTRKTKPDLSFCSPSNNCSRGPQRKILFGVHAVVIS